ncbi:hypothetical protein ACFYV5_06045 [Streptomyces sp. NPDC003035]|uniref:hypothetical protein n=1 Tax=Streptomyces sp. NPDC003035 TaxID=3364676 RepID=UPI0036B11855
MLAASVADTRARGPAISAAHTIPEPRNQRANRRRRGSKGGRPAGFGYIFHGTVTVASIRLWLRP